MDRCLCFVFLCTLLGFTCQKSDVGKPCTANTALHMVQPIVSETPSIETVAVVRDSVCQSLLCLAEGSLAPYCTDTCSASPVKSTSCSTHTDCPREQFCEDGLCHTHTCPSGFYCQHPQPAGPFSAQRMCVRQRGCTTDASCNSLGKLFCKQQACHDVCLLKETCQEHSLVCSAAADFTCVCTLPNTSLTQCPALHLQCTHQNASTPWAQGAVTLQSVCVP